MKKTFLILIVLFGTGCATVIEKKRMSILECTKDLMQNDASLPESFEACRQLYHLKKVGE